jgi:Flp pilus assembly protein TadG
MLQGLFSAALAAGRRVLRENRGNVAMMFALTSVPLLLAGGGIVDYSRATFAHTQMQDALDATSLALARQANLGTMTPEEMQRFAEGYFSANFSDRDVRDLTLTPTYSVAGPSVTINASVKVQTAFLGLIGLNTIPVAASSTTVWGRQRLRVALVLDNTGSMADDGKMDALKVASHRLLAQLKTAASQDGDVYVSLIPFSKDVNVGRAARTQSWVRWDLWEEANGTCSASTYRNRTDCQRAGRTWTAANRATWNGCVTDRDQDYDTTNAAPVSDPTRFPADQYARCPAELAALTYDWAALDTAIDAMRPAGNTNQAIGLQWGWQSLTAAPFTVPAMDPAYQYKQVIILLTDGLNTENRWYKKQSSIDARQETACANAKARDIILYTVQVNTGGDPTSTMLQNCASDPVNGFFLLTSADEIVTTFESIGTALADLRVSS